MSSNIEVAVRVRPMLQSERNANLRVQWDIKNNCSITRAEQQNNTKRRRNDVDKFHFDHIFDERSTNHEVYEKVIQRMISLFLCGYNQNVIAYGEQSTGKTHTLTGTEDDSGIISSTVKYMFDRATHLDNQRFTFKVSCFEVYNDKINDLMDMSNTDLQLTESLSGVVQVVGCKEELVADADSLLGILKMCEVNRKVYDSGTCGRSDKSHVVIRINVVISRNVYANEEEHDEESEYNNRYAQLNIVDLAGRKNDTANLTEEEEFHIDMSLSVLNLVLTQLNKSLYVQKHVNYRESKLVHCLKAAFGGKSHTLFICTISPVSVKETLTTLWFATRAGKVKNRLDLNVVYDYVVKVLRRMDNFNKLILNTMENCRRTFTSEDVKTKIAQVVSNEYSSAGKSIETFKCNFDEMVSTMTKVSKYYLDKMSSNLSLPHVEQNHIFPAFSALRDDLLKLQANMMTLCDYKRNKSNSNGCDLVNLFQNVERSVQSLKPRVQLTKVFLKVFRED